MTCNDPLYGWPGPRVADRYARRASEISIEPVWSGPGTHRVPVRATVQVLVSVVVNAQRELLLMTYTARPHQPLTEAFHGARERGVMITVVVKTLQGVREAR